jgi:uncharacterized protein (TIGR03435 family)
MFLLGDIAAGQSNAKTPAFDVASVRPSARLVGPDENNRITFDPAGITGRNVTLRRCVALTQHSETRDLLVYELVVDHTGPKTGPKTEPTVSATGPGFRFHGDMQRFADLLAVQLSIPVPDDPGRPGRASGPQTPVLDKTGLSGIYDFDVDIRPEPGSDMFALWQRALQEKMGLKLESRKTKMKVLVVDGAESMPTAN